MRLIAKGKDVIDFFIGSYSLISSTLHKIEIFFQENLLCINITVELLYAPLDNKMILLKFENVSAFSFSNNEDYNFSVIEIVKFFAEENRIYFSIDPDEDISGISSTDNDFILSKKIEAYFFSPRNV